MSALTPFSNCQLNTTSLYRLMLFWFITEPQTIYDNIFAIKPAHILQIDQNNHLTEHQWWSPNLNSKSSSLDDFHYKLDHLLCDSVNKRLLADVPVTSLLSGGIDSSLVTSYARQFTDIKPFTMSLVVTHTMSFI